MHYCERFLELLTDLEALLPTRRFFNTVLDDCHLVVRCQLSVLVRIPEGHLFSQVSFSNINIIDKSCKPAELIDCKKCRNTLYHFLCV